MNQIVAWVGFLGAWLLVAGPLYQGALELLEQDIDREGIQASIARIPRPDPPSPWWWLLPPVMYLIRRHRSNAFRQAALAQLTQAQRAQSISFINKATGWFTVALGAALLAAEQTWQVINRQHWPAWLFWILIIVMLSVSVLNTALRMTRGRAADVGDHVIPRACAHVIPQVLALGLFYLMSSFRGGMTCPGLLLGR
jgi:hypothetical protein